MGLVGRKGKLSISCTDTDVHEIAWHRYEDVLTADVFGAYRYLPPSLGILPLLGCAVDDSRLTFSCYLRRHGIELSSLNVVRLRLWPAFRNGREPDVFVLLESTEHKHRVALLVEAKLHSPQHRIGNQSQLGHYLIQHLSDAYADGSLAWDLPQRPRPLLFVTNHTEVPASELLRAKTDVALKLPGLLPEDVGVFWTNWATVGVNARQLWQKHRGEVDSSPWLRCLLDLYEEIKVRDLLLRKPFTGIGVPHFAQLRRPYERSYSVPCPVSAAVLPTPRRLYCCLTAAGLPAVRAQYHRTYQSSQIERCGFPNIYSPSGGNSE